MNPRRSPFPYLAASWPGRLRLSALGLLAGGLAAGLAAAQDGDGVSLWPDAPEWRVYGTVASAMAETEGRFEPARGQIPSTRPAPGDWMEPGFDDREWGYARDVSPGFGEAGSWTVSRIHLRRWFEVENPAEVRDLAIDVEYRGGVVVYVNGTEIGRSHLPEGPLTPDTMAHSYPEEAFFMPDGETMLSRVVPGGAPEEVMERYRMRVRRTGLAIPRSALRPGPNVVAVGVHRAPYLGRALEGHWHGRVAATIWSTTPRLRGTGWRPSWP